jgi:hypothetical protein
MSLKLKKQFTLEHVETAYRKLKRHVYYDKTDLHLRHRIAQFECSDDFSKRLSMVKEVVNSKHPTSNPNFSRWLEEIDFRIVPKSLSPADASDSVKTEKRGSFLSNVTSSKHLDVDKVNYFFEGPIEIHLIAVLWIMFEGRYLDTMLGKECFGSRLSVQLSEENDDSAELFRKYHELYSEWRDSGIKIAKRLLVEDKTSVCILGLDVQEYYYRIKLDFTELSKAIKNEKNRGSNSKDNIDSDNLLSCIESVCSQYRNKMDSTLQLTHDDSLQQNIGIPIGLCTSPLLANWYLVPFDKAIRKNIKPSYYGRYVDDILLVVESSEDPADGHGTESNDYKADSNDPVENFIEDVLIRNGVLDPLKEDRYEIRNPSGLHLQQSKCILQYFDTKHSIAGLDKFQKKLEENSSDFLLLPVDEADSALENVAYELIYEGSPNKFRSVKGLSENRYELAKHLAKQTVLHLVTDDPPNPEVSMGLRKFFKGRNAILFHDLWERVFTYFVIAGDQNSSGKFEKSLRAEINRIRIQGKAEVTVRLKSYLESHLSLSRAMAEALHVEDDSLLEFINLTSLSFKKANLMRHHFVRLPLINYTNYAGALTSRGLEWDISISEEKLKWTPRHVNFDECMLLAQSENIETEDLNAMEWAQEIYLKANRKYIRDIEWDTVNPDMEAGND